MKIAKVDGKIALILDNGEKEFFATNEEAIKRKEELEDSSTIMFEDDWEDDGQPDEAQEWYDFDPDA
ncbi:MAG: hypothetical protein VW518_02070 [Burkholderiaceae bacterium]